jgi:hypothetical protein
MTMALNELFQAVEEDLEGRGISLKGFAHERRGEELLDIVWDRWRSKGTMSVGDGFSVVHLLDGLALVSPGINQRFKFFLLSNSFGQIPFMLRPSEGEARRRENLFLPMNESMEEDDDIRSVRVLKRVLLSEIKLMAIVLEHSEQRRDDRLSHLQLFERAVDSQIKELSLWFGLNDTMQATDLKTIGANEAI